MLSRKINALYAKTIGVLFDAFIPCGIYIDSNCDLYILSPQTEDQ